MSEMGELRIFRTDLNLILDAMTHALAAPDEITKQARMLMVWHVVSPNLANMVQEMDMSRRVLALMHMAALDREPESAKALVEMLHEYNAVVFIPKEKAR